LGINFDSLYRLWLAVGRRQGRQFGFRRHADNDQAQIDHLDRRLDIGMFVKPLMLLMKRRRQGRHVAGLDIVRPQQGIDLK